MSPVLHHWDKGIAGGLGQEQGRVLIFTPASGSAVQGRGESILPLLASFPCCWGSWVYPEAADTEVPVGPWLQLFFCAGLCLFVHLQGR